MKTSRFLTVATLLYLGLLASCASRACAMTYPEYDSIQLGISIEEMTASLGEPFSIHSCEGGGEEYEYIERISQNAELAYENHYLIKVVDGRVVSKRIRRDNRPGYDMIYQADPNYPTYPPY